MIAPTYYFLDAPEKIRIERTVLCRRKGKRGGPLFLYDLDK